jgi:hypothetical protein
VILLFKVYVGLGFVEVFTLDPLSLYHSNKRMCYQGLSVQCIDVKLDVEQAKNKQSPKDDIEYGIVKVERI